MGDCETSKRPCTPPGIKSEVWRVSLEIKDSQFIFKTFQNLTKRLFSRRGRGRVAKDQTPGEKPFQCLVSSCGESRRSYFLPSEEVDPVGHSDVAWNRLSNGNVSWLDLTSQRWSSL